MKLELQYQYNVLHSHLQHFSVSLMVAVIIAVLNLLIMTLYAVAIVNNITKTHTSNLLDCLNSTCSQPDLYQCNQQISISASGSLSNKHLFLHLKL